MSEQEVKDKNKNKNKNQDSDDDKDPYTQSKKKFQKIYNIQQGKFKSESPKVLTNLSHKELYNLLQKALFGLIINGQNLIIAIQTLYDLKSMAEDKGLNPNPCQIGKKQQNQYKIIQQSQQKPQQSNKNKGEPKNDCKCIIGYLLKQQVFINDGKCQQVADKQETSGQIKNLLQGKIAFSLGKSVTDSIANINVGIKNNEQKVKNRSYYTKKFSYIYGYIYLKNNVFQASYLSKSILNLKQQLIKQKAHALQKVDATKSGNPSTSNQKVIVQQFSNQFGDVIATSCSVGVYVATYEQFTLDENTKSREITGGAKFKDSLAIKADSRNKQQEGNKKKLANYILVQQPTIIKRNNYAATNQLAKLYEPSQQQLIVNILKTRFFLIIVKTPQSEYLVNLNLKDSFVWSHDCQFDTKQYYADKRQKNRLYLVTFDQVKAITFRNQQSKYVIQCNIITRSIKKKCRLQIRSFFSQQNAKALLELDNIAIIQEANKKQKIQQIYFSFWQEPPSLMKKIRDFFANLFETKKKTVKAIPVAQKKSFFYLYPFQTKNDKLLKQIYQKDQEKKQQQLKEAKDKMNKPIQENKQKSNEQKTKQKK